MADNYKLIGKGIVAEDKNDNSKFIAVYLPESLPYHSGEINGSAAKISRTIKNAAGEEEVVKIFKKATIKAEWRKTANDRIAPSVRKGETVNIYELVDTNIYYWEALGDSPHLRRKEKFSKVFNAFGESTEIDTTQVKGNTYGVEVDTAAGYLRIWTSADDKEKATFDIDLNGKDGIFTILSSSGLIIQIDDPKDTVLIENAAKSYISMQGSTLTANVKTMVYNAETVTFNVSDTITFNSDTTTFNVKNLFSLNSNIVNVISKTVISIKAILLNISAISTNLSTTNFGTSSSNLKVRSNNVDVTSKNVETKSDNISMAGKSNTINADNISINAKTLTIVIENLVKLATKLANVIIETLSLKSDNNTVISNSWNISNNDSITIGNANNLSISSGSVQVDIDTTYGLTANIYSINTATYSLNSTIETVITTPIIQIHGNIISDGYIEVDEAKGRYCNFTLWSWTP